MRLDPAMSGPKTSEPVVELLAKKLRSVGSATEDRWLGWEPLLECIADDAKRASGFSHTGACQTW
jgi:hypothetical protein